MNKILSKLKNEKGQSLVEFALVLIIFLVIFFAITEFGRAWYRLDVLKNAANIAARTYAVKQNTDAAKSAAAFSNVTVGIFATSTSVTATASERFNAVVPLFPMIGEQFGGTSGRTLSRSATYRIEK